MGRYKLIIDCVDGETTYTLDSPDVALVAAFLRQHDHEGSTLTLKTPRGHSYVRDHDVYLALGMV